jgi:asparagine synthase (glutamine-hydrolysing)
MCGIAGRFNFDPLRLVDRDVLAAMTDVIAHRGPDASGFHVAAGSGWDIAGRASST